MILYIKKTSFQISEKKLVSSNIHVDGPWKKSIFLYLVLGTYSPLNIDSKFGNNKLNYYKFDKRKTIIYNIVKQKDKYE